MNKVTSTICATTENGDRINLFVSRSPSKIFTIKSNSYAHVGGDPIESDDQNNNKPIKSADDLLSRLRGFEAEFKFIFNYQDVVDAIARLDWPVAAVLSKKLLVNVPRLPNFPDLKNQHSLRRIKGVEIAASWNYEWHHVRLSFERWLKIMTGEADWKNTRWAGDGFWFTACWNFKVSEKEQIYIPGCWAGSFRSADRLKGPDFESYDLAILALESVEQNSNSKKFESTMSSATPARGTFE